MKKGRICGIDLGLTHSCIAYADEHGGAFVLPNTEGGMTTPSVVYFESKDNIVVGQAAREAVWSHPDRCISSIRREMGNPHWEREFYGKIYRPQDISALILRKLTSDAEKIIGDKIEDVALTCPADFGTNEKTATRQAGALAGLNVLCLIPEPASTALAYGIEQDHDQVVLVYDLGENVFNITVIEIKSGDINIICTDGDPQFGGKDWDDAIVSFFIQKFKEATGASPDSLLNDQETYQELLDAAERCKKRLSYRKSAVEAICFNGHRVIVELTQEKFSHLTEACLRHTLDITERQIHFVHLTGVQIDRFLLAGAATQMPQVEEALERRFLLEIVRDNPHSVKAKGAAIFGQRFSRSTSGYGMEYDIFLSHNSHDKVLVIQLAEILEKHGIRVWLDAWELTPGRPWPKGLEEAIQASRAAAVLVGRDGLGPWEEPEMYGCLHECVSRQMPVIPVLLPGATRQPVLPLFLRSFTWVDLRNTGFTEEGITMLLWGITGRKPARKRG